MNTNKHRGAFEIRKHDIVYKNNQDSKRTHKSTYPHDDIYWKLINFLKSKGYATMYDPCFKGEYACLKKQHYMATKGEVLLLFSKYPAGFAIKVELSQNKMDSLSDFWSEWNDKYVAPNYLQKKRIELAIKHISSFFRAMVGISEIPPRPTDPIKSLWYSENINKHIHGGAQNWDELKTYCDKNVSKYNAKDRNGNLLRCGEIKYFYSSYHGNRLCKAEVWHNTNNMWWAIIGNEKYNIASHDYFDYSHDLPKKDLKKAIEKINTLLKKYAEEMNFEKCIMLRNHLQKITNAVERETTKIGQPCQ